MFNIGALDSIADDVVEFAPAIVNFLPVNLFDGAKDQCSQIDYAKAGKAICAQLNRLDVFLPKALKLVRYAPFCAFPGHEDRVVGTFQHIYDWFDWNVELTGLRILDLIDDPDALAKLGPYGSTSFAEADRCREDSYEKSPDCLRCKYLYVCDGVEKTPGHRLLKYVKPCIGIFLKSANSRIGLETEKFYRKIYGIV